MAKTDQKPGEQPTKKGFMLLKSGKSIAGTRHARGKDIIIFKDGKKDTLKNITKKSYVSTDFIEKMKLDLRHFEEKVFDQVPAID